MHQANTEAILIVDDHVDNLRILSNILKHDYRVRAATSGEEALRLLAVVSPVPDLILLDIMMPGMDGYTVCKEIKADLRTREIPVVFLTARNQPEDEFQGFAVGAVDYVTKPVNPPLLLARIQAQLALAAQLKQARKTLEAGNRFVAKVIRERDASEAHVARLEHEIAERERAEAALRESQARFIRLTRGLKDHVLFFTHSLQGELLYVSEGFEFLSVTSHEEAIGQLWSDVVDWTPESLDHGLEQNRLLLAGDITIAEFEMAYQHPTFGLRYLTLHEYLIHEQGRVLIEGVAIDVTRQKLQEAQLRTLVRAVEQASASIVVSDHVGNIIYINPYFTQITGYYKEEIIGKNPRILKSGEHNQEFYQTMWATLSSGQTWRGEIVNRKKDGSLFWESTSISPILDTNGAVVNYVSVKEDISDRKSLDRLKEDVERIMRHDLKTPLNAIIGFPQVLEFDDNLTDEQREILALIKESGQKMLDMIDASLDLFKMETGRYIYMPQSVDIIELLLQLAKITQPRLEEKQLHIELTLGGCCVHVEKQLLVRADRRLLFSILSNLLSNAIEASPPAEIITIDLEQQEAVTLAMCNIGTVAEAIRKHFFEKYKTYGKQGGTGLGTYSAKLMSDVMGFKIYMDTSDTENRTCIWLTMPSSV
ncbi:PAS domain S-box protein [Thiospirillum jenense]|uniref:histidine kinase n=2 Tax=Thiospirillum jenense TaxID=1653858 RepID=A0A839H6V4_9GAMM|nr:PAS domain S-box protein [Thiospirillum jenense]